jgi:hypothetical protein
MIDYRRLAIALAASIIVATAITATAAMDHHAYLPFVHGAAVRLTGSVPPPAGTSCLLQTGASMVVDPRTDEQVFSCESKFSHGAIVFTAHKLLLDHVATGSGSLSVIDAAVYVTAVREDGSLEVQKVPTP